MNGEVDHAMKIAENETETTARATATYGRLATLPARGRRYVTPAPILRRRWLLGWPGRVHPRRWRHSSSLATYEHECNNRDRGDGGDADPNQDQGEPRRLIPPRGELLTRDSVSVAVVGFLFHIVP